MDVYGEADGAHAETMVVLPRFDGIFVSVAVGKDRPSPRADPMDGRLQITAPSGDVSDATIEQDRLVWDSAGPFTQGGYTFLSPVA